MAEIVGVASAGIGVAAFALQVDGAIKRLRDIREYTKSKAGEDADLLIRRLEVLQQNLLLLENRQTSTALARAVENCQSVYSSVDTALQKVNSKLSSSSRSRLRGLRHGEGLRTQLEDIGRKLDYVVGDLTSCVPLGWRQKLTAPPALPSRVSSGSTEPNKQSENVHLEVQTSISDAPWADTALISYLKTSWRWNRAADCKPMHCYCSCHSQHRSSARFWTVEYTPLSAILSTCSNPKCTGTCYRWNLQLALSNYGIPLKIGTAITFFAGGRGLSLQPSLSIDRVVKYTSPGFETLWRFQRGLLSIGEFQDSFRKLKRSDPSINRHINPGGRTYVQELICYGPRTYAPLHSEFKVLKFFVDELGMTLQGLDQKFLVECANWIGEGPHLDLLEAILEYGFDPGFTKSSFYEKWPSPCSPNWYSEVEAPDPFFVRYLALLATASPGFAGLTPLHEMVLLATPEIVASFILRYSVHMERNFLGQTPLHLAVCNVEMVRLLINHDHSMDITDNHGITALMYAAGMGKTDVVMLLIEKGANPLIRDPTWKRDFIGYADARGHWDLIMDALGLMQTIYPSKLAQYFITCGLMTLLIHDVWLGARWSTYFARLVSQCSDTNMKVRDCVSGTERNSFLHFVSNAEDVRILVRNGFKLFNEPNSAGQTAMFSLAPRLDATLCQSLVDYGVNVNHVDHDGLTVLFTLLHPLTRSDFRIFDIIDSIHVCLSAGLDVFLADGCRCPCSPNGCSLAAAFYINFEEKIWPKPPAFVWALEFVSLVEEVRGYECAKSFLLALLRRSYSDRMEITHVCCHRGHGIKKNTLFGKISPMPNEDIEEIMEEEDEFIAQLEKEMVPMASETLGSLRSKWISMLKERYHEQLAAMEKRRKATTNAKEPLKDKYEVDTRNDTFKDLTIVAVEFSITPVSQYMAEYIIWLEHQYTRPDQRGLSASEKEAWYERRMTWFVELMQVMEVDTETLSTEIKTKIEMKSWNDKDRPDSDRIVGHFTASVQTMLKD
ncbi:ankyrin repeat domain-containing protein [Aspergillus stella-maris]|uniref:ankyrin repeat domain-containing protein n=1 Tax=Aspergillus stella-maris TaxID=1810926 RepID=UPI003CCE0B95